MSKHELATRQDHGMVIGGDVDLEELAHEAAPLAGAGTSQAREDNIIPFLAVLQDLSPQVKARDPKYIDGAQVGDILRTDIQRVYSGTEGIIFQPCFFSKKWVEWVPRKTGGGFVQVFEVKPEGLQNRIEDGALQQNKWFNPKSGNDMVETRYHFGNLLDPTENRTCPVVIGMTSTMHTVSRQWMALMNQFKAGGVIAPSFFRAYRLQTVMRSKNNNDWYVWKLNDLGWVNKPLRELGHELYKSIASGEKMAATPEEVMEEAHAEEVI